MSVVEALQRSMPTGGLQPVLDIGTMGVFADHAPPKFPGSAIGRHLAHFPSAANGIENLPSGSASYATTPVLAQDEELRHPPFAVAEASGRIDERESSVTAANPKQETATP